MLISDVANLFEQTVASDDKSFTSVSTDTRSLEVGDLFIALKGDNFDGHEYLDLAAEKGAVAAIVDHDVDTNLPTIKVHDTKLALGQLAAYWRQQLDIKMVGLTGSNGKTTVKEMLVCILSEVGKVSATTGNFNNDIGLPLTLLKVKPEHEYGVIEMGANHIGEIAYLTGLTSPDIALLNNAAPAHLEGFGSLQGVADAKGEIFSGLNQEGIAVINMDDDFSDYWTSMCADHKKIFFGLDAAADVTTSTDLSDYSGQFVLESDSVEIEVQLHVLGLHNLKNALAASAVSIGLGIELDVIKRGLEKFNGVKGRLQINHAANDSLIIDDTYNANPTSVRAAIDVLAAQEQQSILVLGDMGELGEGAEQLHADIGNYAKDQKIDYLMAFGKLSSFAAKKFGENACVYTEKEELIKDLKKHLDKKVAVLVKGSRGMHMEDVVTAVINKKAGLTLCC